MHSKETIFNLALNALLLAKPVINADTDNGTNLVVLRNNFPIALASTLQEMDLDSTSTHGNLETVASNPTMNWLYAYKYPADCAFFRRIQSGAKRDGPDTFIDKQVGIFQGKKVIFTNQEQAVGEWVSTNTPLAALSASAGYAIALRLALMSAPLIVGKGAKGLLQDITTRYMTVKGEAQQQDALENFEFPDSQTDSTFVKERMS